MRETREVSVSKSEQRRQTKQVPKYPTLDLVLGLSLDTHAPTAHPQEATNPATPGAADPGIESTVDELRRDPGKLIDFLRLNGDA